MATKIIEWIAKLDDQISGAAEQAARALDDMRDALKNDQGELTAMRKQMAALRGGGKLFEDQIKKLKLQIDAKRQSIAKSQADYIRLGGKLGDTRHRTAKLTEAFKDLHGGLRALPGPIGQFYNSLSSVAEKIPKTRILAVALGLGFVALGGAAVAGTAALTKFGIAAQDARRNELLLLEAHTRVRNLWGFPPGKSKDMQAAIDRIAPNVSIARSEVAALQTQLYTAGLRGEKLDTVLEAAAIKQSALGGAAGSAFASFATAVAITGGSWKRAAQDVKNRFGDVVQQKMKSLEVQTLKQKENMEGLFSGIDIEPFLTALKRLRDIFDSNTAAGTALKSLIGGIVQPAVNGTATALVWFRRFFKQVLIGLMEIKIGVKTFYVWWLRVWGGVETKSAFKDFMGSVQWGKVLVWVLAAAFLKLAFAVALAFWPFIAGALVIWGVYEALNALYQLWDAIDWSDLGSAIVDGLANGLSDAWHVMKEAVTGLGDKIKGWFTGVFEIKSPSKVFMRYGLAMPQGLTQGIKQGQNEAAKAAGNMVPAPQPSAAANAPSVAPLAAPARAPGPSRGGSITIGSITVSAASGEPKDVAIALRRELETVLAGLATQLGAT